jgi:hypothetical protein
MRFLLSCSVVIGMTKDDQPYFSSTTGDIGHALYMLERSAKVRLGAIPERS